jgi:hypothetical protein
LVPSVDRIPENLLDNVHQPCLALPASGEVQREEGFELIGRFIVDDDGT